LIFSNDGYKQLGTGGSIIKAANKISSKDFFVLFGDSYLNVNYINIYKKYILSKKLGLMTVNKNNNQNNLYGEGLSDVEYINNTIIKYDKIKRNNRMLHINYGIGIFNKSIIKKFNYNKAFDIQYIYQKLINSNQLAGFEIKRKFYEIGSKKGILLTKKYFKKLVIND